MNRPTCQTCPSFVPGPGGAGTCRQGPPTLGIVLKLVREEKDGEEASRTTVRPSQGWFGRWPVVDAESACCSLHPLHAAFAAGFLADGGSTVGVDSSTGGDDAGNF